MSRHQTSIPEAFAAMKAETSQTYELAREASKPGKKLSLTGSVGADADYHIQNQNDYLKMIAFVRMMERNDPIISSAKRRLRDNVNVGQMTPNPLTDSKDLNEHLKGKWLEYASNKDKFDSTAPMMPERLLPSLFCLPKTRSSISFYRRIITPTRCASECRLRSKYSISL